MGLISKYKALIQLNSKNKNLIKKCADDPNRHLSKERHTYVQEVQEKVLNVTNHQEMQIKTTMRYHLTPVRMAIIKKTRNNTIGKNVEK